VLRTAVLTIRLSGKGVPMHRTGAYAEKLVGIYTSDADWVNALEP
jgi:hypothetical protein